MDNDSIKGGFIDGRLVFYQISFSYKGFNSLNEADRRAFMAKLEAKIKEINDKSGPTLQCYLSSFDVFPWIRFNQIIVGDAQQGVMISLIFAFIVLFATTHNIIVSLLATYSISAIIL